MRIANGADNLGRCYDLVRGAGFQVSSGQIEALMGPQVGFALGVGLISDHVNVFEVQCCWVGPGSGEIIMTGNVSRETEEAIQFCKAFIDSRVAEIVRCMGPPSDPQQRFERAGHDLHVHINHNWRPVTPSYQIGAIMISMIALLSGRSPRADTAIFGNMLPSGQLVSDWIWSQEMTKACYCNSYISKVRRAVVAKGTVFSDDVKRVADSISPKDGQPFLRYHHLNTIFDALPLCFDLSPSL